MAKIAKKNFIVLQLLGHLDRFCLKAARRLFLHLLELFLKPVGFLTQESFGLRRMMKHKQFMGKQAMQGISPLHLEDLLAGAERLRPADLQNRKTHEAGHNTTDIDTLLTQFRNVRMGTVGRLEQTSGEGLRHTSLHPRLEQAMTVVDLFFFVAEHDDHHLARIGDIIDAQGSGA